MDRLGRVSKGADMKKTGKKNYINNSNYELAVIVSPLPNSFGTLLRVTLQTFLEYDRDILKSIS